MNLTVFCGQENLNREIKGGYTSDLLSDVMGFAREGQVWITLQTHKNVLAIASLKELAAILLVKGNKPEDDMLEQAVEEGSLRPYAMERANRDKKLIYERKSER